MVYKGCIIPAYECIDLYAFKGPGYGGAGVSFCGWKGSFLGVRG